MAGRSVLLFILLPPDAPILPEYMNWATNPRFRASQLLDGMYDVIKDNILRHVIRQDRVFRQSCQRQVLARIRETVFV